MSQMKNQPVLLCKRCGSAYTFSLKTTSADIEGVQLFKFMDEIAKDHLCPRCKAAQTWYASQGRIAEWEAGNA
jgi:rubredoxin